MSGKIVKVSGPLIVAEGMKDVQLHDMVRVSDKRLIGEVIELRDDKASIQVYEETAGLGPGEPVESTGSPMSVELAPGLIESIFDGIQRPLEKIYELAGDRISRGVEVPKLNREKKWQFVPVAKPGDQVSGGDVIGTVQETPAVLHKIMVPPGKSGTVEWVYEGEATILDPVYKLKDSKGNVVATEHHTPMSFLEKYGDTNLLTNYVMVMNDPSREYYKCYEIAYDRHRYDGKNWTYVNLPVEEIKEMAIASLKDSTRMYFSSDVTQLDSKRGLLDVNNYDFGSLMGTTFGMDKKQRIQTFSSGSSHAMTLMAVDLDKAGKPKKWMVENSWGSASGYRGHLIMTDKWFDEYMFRVVAEKKYVPAKVLDILKQKPIRLPAWDPMFADEE